MIQKELDLLLNTTMITVSYTSTVEYILSIFMNYNIVAVVVYHTSGGPVLLFSILCISNNPFSSIGLLFT